MFAPVEPALASPPAMGLIVSARTPRDETRWQQGVAWRSEYCPTARTFQACGTDDGFESPGVGGGNDGINYAVPVPFRVEDECSTRTNELADSRARVLRQARASVSYMAARELELGAATRALPYETPFGDTVSNAYLASPDATVVDDDPWQLVAGLGALEEAARDNSLGMEVFLHVPLRLVPLLGDAVVRDGNLLRTRTGSQVVADAGYSGSGPFVPATSEVQTVTITGGPTGGDFTLTVAGETTDDIAYNATATVVGNQINAALAAAEVDGGVTVTGSAGGPYTVTFDAEMGNVATMSADGSGLTGGTAPSVGVAVTTPGTDSSFTDGLWIYATGPVTVRVTEPEVDQRVDHLNNRVLTVADTLFLATFDPCTLHALAVVDPAPTP